MHYAAVLCVALAGLCFCWSVWRWWRHLRQGEGELKPVALFAGVIALTAGLVLSLIDGTHPSFVHAVVGIWAGLGSVVFLRRYLTSPSRRLLVLPVGAMALLVAAAGLAPAPAADSSTRWLIIIHVGFMTLALTAHLVAAGSGMLFLAAVRHLKAGDALALRLPALPGLERISETAMIVATALLLGGLATGSVAMRASQTFTLSHPAALLALLDMSVLVASLALRNMGHLGRRGMAVSAIASAVILALATASFIALRHG